MQQHEGLADPEGRKEEDSTRCDSVASGWKSGRNHACVSSHQLAANQLGRRAHLGSRAASREGRLGSAGDISFLRVGGGKDVICFLLSLYVSH